MRESLKRRDYHKWHWSKRELGAVLMKTAGVVLLLAWFFYRSFWAVLPLSAVGFCFFRMTCQRMQEKCRDELNYEFKECILSVATSLRAGYAVENAFLESRSDMRLLFGENSLIYEELEGIRRGLVIHITLEDLLSDLAERSDSEEISQFAQVFAIAKRNGGSLPEIIHSSAQLIGQRIDARQEINTLLSGRRMEQTIMKAIPFGILLYVGGTSPGYFDALYHNLQGIAIMTGCLGVYLAAYLIGDKILQQIAAEMS